MKTTRSFFRSVAQLAIPAALQSMLQSSFSIVDQIMIGQLGSVSIAGVGLAGKFCSIFSVVTAAIGAVAGIMLSQYLGQKNDHEVRRSFFLNLWLSLGLAAIFTVLCVCFPLPLMRLYTDDAATAQAGAEYLSIIVGTFFPLAGATMLSTLLRCVEKPRLPLYASLVSALVNTVLNYALIFGHGGLPAMGARGAALASVISQLVNVVLMLLMLRGAPLPKKQTVLPPQRFNWGQYLSMLLPIFVCEVLWSLGENVYAVIYGHMGTDSTAAMTLINPVQGLLVGALCGLSQAAGVLIGKLLGADDFDGAYHAGKKLLVYGTLSAVCLSVVVVATRGLYVRLYQVDDTVRQLSTQLLLAYALVAPFKVLNMILGGGILRSGGKTNYIMFIDIFGTWGIGVPLGLLAAFVLRLSIPYVYFLLSLEECVRFVISLVVFRRKKWMRQLAL